MKLTFSWRKERTKNPPYNQLNSIFPSSSYCHRIALADPGPSATYPHHSEYLCTMFHFIQILVKTFMIYLLQFCFFHDKGGEKRPRRFFNICLKTQLFSTIVLQFLFSCCHRSSKHPWKLTHTDSTFIQLLAVSNIVCFVLSIEKHFYISFDFSQGSRCRFKAHFFTLQLWKRLFPYAKKKAVRLACATLR